MIVNECVHAYKSGFQTIAGDSAWHTLDMDTEVADTNSYHDNTTNKSRLTFAAGGVFLVMGHASMSNPTGTVAGRLAKNGTATGYVYNENGAAAGPTSLCGVTMFWLQNFSAGDYMESQGWNNNGGSVSAQAQMCALGVNDFSCHVADTADHAGSSILTFATVVYDPNGMATATDRIECQKAGYYLVLSSVDGASDTLIEENGSSSALNGSRASSADGQGLSSHDYTVAWFEIGDYVRVHQTSSSTVHHRQFAMVYLGGVNAGLSYTFSSVDLANTDAGFVTGILRTDSEWIDTGHGHPQHGFSYNTSPAYCISCGSFNMVDGYHFALAKICTDGGTFLQNDGASLVLNGSALGNVVSSHRHASGSRATAIAFSCFHATYGDTLTGNWLASGTFTETAFTPFTNVFVTDAAEGGPQIYRRL